MKIFIIQTPYYDFNSATLIQGLRKYSIYFNVEIKCSEKSNYASIPGSDFSVSENEITKNVEEADIVVITSNQGVKYQYVDLEKYRNKTVFIDGNDRYLLERKTSNYALYFKREMLTRVDYEDNVFPFPFGIEDRYFYNIKGNKNIPVSCMFGEHDDYKPWRRLIEERLNEIKQDNWVIGKVYGGNKSYSIDTGDRDHKKYYEVLSRSLISVDAYGAFACNAARFWESIANKCLLFTQPILIQMPNQFSSEHIVEYRDLEELQRKIEEYLVNHKEIERLSRNAFDYAIKYHTTYARAAYFLDICTDKIIRGLDVKWNKALNKSETS